MKQRIILLYVLLLTGCFEQQQKNIEIKNYDVDKNTFVNDFNQFLSDIKNRDNDFLENFIIDTINKDKKGSKIVHLFGEHHLDKEGIKNILSYVILLAQSGPIKVLREGLSIDHKPDSDNKNLRTIEHIFGLFLRQKYIDINGAVIYDPSAVDTWVTSQIGTYYEVLIRNILDKKINFQGMALSNIQFGGWDSVQAAPSGWDGLVARNTSLVNAIEKTEPTMQLAIMAGFSHLPLGDYYGYQKNRNNQFSVNPDYASFYSKLAGDQSMHRAGSTEIIYQSAVKNDWTIIQAIPKSSLSLWEQRSKKRDF